MPATVIGALWLLSLPRLDPTGHEDSAPAVRAMIRGEPVMNVATYRPMTRTGWPFFDKYGGEDEK